MEDIWTQEQNDKFKEEFYKGFIDTILLGRSKYQIKDGNLEHIPFHIEVDGFDFSNPDIEVAEEYIHIEDVMKEYSKYINTEENK